MIGYLRDMLGFSGLLMTDDIGMNALGGSMAGRSARAIGAGCDIVLHCSGDLTEMEDVASAVGPLQGAAADRAEAALRARLPSPEIDIAALAAEFDALTSARA